MVAEPLLVRGAHRDGRLQVLLQPRNLTFAAVACLLFYLVAFPLGALVWQSLQIDLEGGLTLRHYLDFFTDERLLTATRNTVAVGLVTAVGSVILATPLAFGVARTNMRGKTAVKLSVLISFASPPFLMTLSYVLLAGPNNGYINQVLRTIFGLDVATGPVNIYSLAGFIFLALPNTVAFAFVIMLPGFSNMDPALEEASRVAGAGPMETVARISLPVMGAGMLAAALLSFSTALAMFATPHILGIDVLTVSMRRAIVVSADFTLAATIAIVSAAMSIIALWLYRRSISASKRFQTVSGRGYRPATLNMGAGRHALTLLAWVYAVLGVFLPYSFLVLVSFMHNPYGGLEATNFTLSHYTAVFTDEQVRSALINSAVLAISAATAIAGIGFVIAYWVSRTQLPGRALADYLSVLPLGIAGTAFAVGVAIANLRTPASGLGLYGTIWILLIAYVGRYLPWGVRASQVQLLQLSSELDEASRTCGATELKTIWHIILPLAKRGLAYAWILGVVQALTEVSASVILISPNVEVAATALLRLWTGSYGLPRASALGVVMLGVTLLLVLAAQRIGGRSIIEGDR